MQRAAGGFGGLRVHSRNLIPVPFDPPEDDYTVLIGDWFKKSHTVLKQKLDSGHSFGRPDGVPMLFGVGDCRPRTQGLLSAGLHSLFKKNFYR